MPRPVAVSQGLPLGVPSARAWSHRTWLTVVLGVWVSGSHHRSSWVLPFSILPWCPCGLLTAPFPCLESPSPVPCSCCSLCLAFLFPLLTPPQAGPSANKLPDYCSRLLRRIAFGGRWVTTLKLCFSSCYSKFRKYTDMQMKITKCSGPSPAPFLCWRARGWSVGCSSGPRAAGTAARACREFAGPWGPSSLGAEEPWTSLQGL